jgi:hypothetical protein
MRLRLRVVTSPAQETAQLFAYPALRLPKRSREISRAGSKIAPKNLK